jgi:hypothetical protein
MSGFGIKRRSPMMASHAFKRILLHLARSKEFPSGSVHHGYELIAPLDGKGHIDVQIWKEHRDRCRVRRFWNGEGEQAGFLVHKPGGSEHARWIFDYDAARTDDDEAGYRFGAHVFAPGEYLTLRDMAGEHTFRIVSVENAG